jgi:hypothetical protein
VRVVCEPGVTIEGLIEVKQLEAGKQLAWSGGAHKPSGTLRLHAYGIRGRVLLDEIRLDGRQTLPGLLWESSGGYLSVNGSKLSGAPAVDLRYASEVVLSGCSVTTHANVLTTPTPGVSAYQTTLTVAQCQIQGPGGYVTSGAGIRFSQYPSFWGEVRVSGDSSSWIVGGGFSPQVAIEMAGGILRRDPRPLLYGSIDLTSGATQSVGSIPAQTVLAAGIGGTLKAEAVHSSSGVVVMYMGLPAPQPLPVFAYPSPLFHIDPATMILLTSAVYKEKVSVPVGVPNNASLRGLVLTFQTLAGSDPIYQRQFWTLSNPATTVIR